MLESQLLYSYKTIQSTRRTSLLVSAVQQSIKHQFQPAAGRRTAGWLALNSKKYELERAFPHSLDGSRFARESDSCNDRRPAKHVCSATGALACTVAAAAPSGATGMQGMATFIGWLVIAGSCVRSLPQIARIIKNKSVEGLSLLSFASELAVYTVSVVYNIVFQYPFSTYGDLVTCWLQNVLIIVLMFVHGTISGPVKAMVTLGFAGLLTFLLSGTCSSSTLQALQASSVVLLALGGRVPQIVLNIRRGNSGELSMLSTGLSLLGNFARVITTLVLVKDVLILASSVSQAVLNTILLWQCLQTQWRAQRTVQAQPSSL